MSGFVSPMISAVCAASSVTCKFESGVDGFSFGFEASPAYERTGSARTLIGVRWAMDGREATLMARPLEALHKESRGDMAGLYGVLVVAVVSSENVRG